MARFCSFSTLSVIVLILAFLFLKYEKQIRNSSQLYNAAYRYYHTFADTSNGYGAKLGCSIVFVANRTLQSALDAELLFPPIFLGSTMTADYDRKCVTAHSRLVTNLTRTACWKSPRLGCSLVFDGYDYQPPPSTVENTASPLPWPNGDVVDQHKIREASHGVNLTRLDEVVSAHFNDTRLHARGFILIRKGQIIYEKYGDNCTQHTPLIGWSMTKSVINALLGIRVRQGHLALDKPFNVPEWKNTNKSELTLGQLLRMSDGFDFDEWYYPAFDVPNMLFLHGSLADAILNRTLRRTMTSPCFQYSSGTTNLLCYLLRQTFQDESQTATQNHQDYLEFPTRELFEKIHMNTAVLETDASGTFIGSSFSWATARDWARFGLLYLHDGKWGNTRILPEGWVKFSSTHAPTSNGWYGAHFWLGGEDPETNQTLVNECDEIYHSRRDPDRDWLRKAFPKGTFVAHGFEEQALAILPKYDMIMVRLGASKEVVVRWDKPAFYSSVFATVSDISG